MIARLDLLAGGAADADVAAAVLATGALADAVRHGEDLVAIAQIGGTRWTDALLSEIRSHIAGCLNSVELAIRLELAEPRVAQALDGLGEGICRMALDNALILLSPALVEHFRLRAAAALVLRMRQAAPPLSAFEGPGDSESATAAVDAELGDALTALALAIDPWHEPHAATRPMRADLPAEAYCELGWVAAALLLDALERAGADSAAAIWPVTHAVDRLIARHDEQNGPFARAAFAAGLVPDGKSPQLAANAVLDRNLLLLGALAARTARLGMDVALAILTDGDEAERSALARVLGLGDDGYASLLAMLAPLRGGMTDAPLMERMADYRLLTAEAAMAMLSRRRGPEALVSRRLRLDRARR